MTKFQKIFYDIKNTEDYKVVGEDIDYKVMINDEDREIILQFKESDSRQDWKHNISFIPVPLNIGGRHIWTTRGYACAYKSAEDKPVLDFISECEEHKEYKKIIRGWSFGSAMTKIAVRHYYNLTGEAVDEEITYGDVKCLFNPFSFIKDRKCAKVIYNFVTVNDFVTWQVPFYFRSHKCKLPYKLHLIDLFHTEYIHTHYEEYDYSRWE